MVLADKKETNNITIVFELRAIKARGKRYFLSKHFLLFKELKLTEIV